MNNFTYYETLLSQGVLPEKDFFKEFSQDFLSWYDKIYYSYFLNQFAQEEDLIEIFFHSYSSIILKFFSKPSTHYTDIFFSEHEYCLFLQTFALKRKISWNQSQDFVCFFTEINLILFRVTLTFTVNGPKMFLRKIQSIPLSIHNFCVESTFVDSLILKKKNILIAGSTGSGKSSLLSSLLTFVPPEEHLVILEDHFELTCSLPLVTRLVGHDFSVLVPRSLRMTPDRIIIGEIRSNEVLGLQLVLNTGHQGVLATLHASSAVNALERLALLYTIYAKNLDYTLSLKLFCQNIHNVIFLHKGKIEQIIEVKGSLGDKVLYIE